MQVKPYEHDCDRCIWVGWIDFGDRLGNMYFCPNDSKHHDTAKRPGSVIIRFSDEPSDYWSNGVGYCSKGDLGFSKSVEAEMNRIQQAEAAINAARRLLYFHKGTSDENHDDQGVLKLLNAYADRWHV